MTTVHPYHVIVTVIIVVVLSNFIRGHGYCYCHYCRTKNAFLSLICQTVMLLHWPCHSSVLLGLLQADCDTISNGGMLQTGLAMIRCTECVIGWTISTNGLLHNL